jgi:transposase-like protein
MNQPIPQLNKTNGLDLKPKRPPLRHWEIDVKRRIVEETLKPGASVAAIARAHNANANMVFRWRREYRRGELGPQAPADRKIENPGFVAVGVIDDRGQLVRNYEPACAIESRAESASTPATALVAMAKPTSRIDLELPGQVRLSFDASLEPEALKRLIALVKEVS